MYINLYKNYYIKSLPRCFAIGYEQKNKEGELQFVAKWYFTTLRSGLRAWIDEKLVLCFKELRNDVRALNDEMDIIIKKINEGISDDKNKFKETIEILNGFDDDEDME